MHVFCGGFSCEYSGMKVNKGKLLRCDGNWLEESLVDFSKTALHFVIVRYLSIACSMFTEDHRC